MAASLRVQNVSSDNDANLVASLTGVVSGDLLLACIYERDGTAITGVSDDINGSWTQAVTRGAIAARIGIFYFANAASGNPTITAAIAGTAPKGFNVSAWSGVVTSSPLDTTGNAGNNAAGMPPNDQTHGSITPSAASLIITATGYGNDPGAITLHSGFTALTNDTTILEHARQSWAYKPGHTGTINPTHVSTNSQSSDAVCAAFLEAAVVAATTPMFPPQFRGARRAQKRRRPA
jgi:hypothetical protein